MRVEVGTLRARIKLKTHCKDKSNYAQLNVGTQPNWH